MLSNVSLDFVTKTTNISILAEHKVKVFEHLTSLLEQRLKHPETEFASKDESDRAQSMHRSMMNGRNAFFILNLLAKYRLLNAKTSQLSGQIRELCKYIFERLTKWDNLDVIGKRVFKFVK
jgi:hypothetical protein